MQLPRTNSMAIVSLVFGIASWVICPIIGGVVAVITGHRARREVQMTGESGDGLALAGMILGYLNLAMLAVAIVVILLLVVVGVTFSRVSQ